MRAFQIEGPGVVKEIAVPVPEIAEDEALNRIQYSGICATDYEILGGEMALIREGKIRYPVRFGHEWSGVIEKVGSAVKHFKPGDRVMSDSGIACGKCQKTCPEGAIAIINNIARIDYSKCTACGKCAEVCPVGCIRTADYSGKHKHPEKPHLL